MRSCPLLLLLCVMDAALCAPFESEDVLPVRTRSSSSSGRLRKRSQEQPRFLLSAFGKDMTLNLVPDTSFLAPSFSIQRISASGAAAPRSSVNQTEESGEQLRGCFYSGTVDGEQDSLVSVSLCSGIFGSFITGGRQYLIEPKVRGAPRPEATEQLHVIRRRTLSGSHRVPLLFDQAAAERRGGERVTRGAGGGDARREPRRKRFVSAPRFIETLVVADPSMTHFYGDEIKVRHPELTLSCTRGPSQQVLCGRFDFKRRQRPVNEARGCVYFPHKTSFVAAGRRGWARG